MTARPWAVAAALGAAVLVAACGSSPDVTEDSTERAPAPKEQQDPATDRYGAQAPSSGRGPATATGAVKVADFAFVPAEVTIRAGGSVRWTFLDEAGHDATAVDRSFASEVLASGGTYAFTFPKAGTFEYFCSIHPTMTGTVVVQ